MCPKLGLFDIDQTGLIIVFIDQPNGAGTNLFVNA